MKRSHCLASYGLAAFMSLSTASAVMAQTTTNPPNSTTTTTNSDSTSTSNQDNRHFDWGWLGLLGLLGLAGLMKKPPVYNRQSGVGATATRP